jgi:N6-adenosine-specific RNA methylase IME4
MKPMTGYSIYNKEVQERTKVSRIPDLYPDFPPGRFDVIYADPPWDYGGKLQFDRSSCAHDEIDPSKKIFISSASFKYPTLKIDELMRIPVSSIASENCLVFMWTTGPHLSNAIDLGRAWGFEYKTVGFVWDKMIHNPGKYTLSNCEFCLIFKKGKIPQPRGVRNIQQLIRSSRRGHSVKPDEVRNAISAMFPTQKRIELFARAKYGDWVVWGLDVMDDTLQELILTGV